jgi:hypothetical protein
MATLPAGIPPLLGDVAGLFLSRAAALVADTFIGYGAGEPPLWGVFMSGVPVVLADTVTEMGYKQDWAIADYPVERGGFESYDKVNTPFAVHMQFVSGGTEERRQALLDSIAAIGDTLTLFDVVTPEAVYIGVNLQSYNYRRATRNGLGLMIVNVVFLEIREEGVTDFKNAKSPSGYAADQAGNVQSVDSSTLSTATTDQVVGP